MADYARDITKEEIEKQNFNVKWLHLLKDNYCKTNLKLVYNPYSIIVNLLRVDYKVEVAFASSKRKHLYESEQNNLFFEITLAMKEVPPDCNEYKKK